MTKTEFQMVNVLEELGFRHVSANMEDEHATYFTATANGNDYEVQIVTETGEIAARENVDWAEDWNTVGWFESGEAL